MDDLVQSVVCYNPRPLILHGYLAPFFVLQAAVYYYFSWGRQQDSSEANLTLSINSNDEAANRHSYEIGVIAVTVSIAAQLITYLFCHWSVDVKCFLSYTRCYDPHSSKFVKVTPRPNNGSTELVQLNRETVSRQNVLSFVFQKTKYVYSEKAGNFITTEFPCDKSISHYKQWKGYQDQNEINAVDRQYGRNELDMVIPEFKELFIERATAPFFVFQTFCVGLWCLDEYWYYAIFTLFMLVTFEAVLVKHQLRNMQEIRRMGNLPFTMQVFRQNKWRPIKSDQLVPGDLVNIVRSDHNIPCDILLIRGSCIIDESTLTGESVPQMKEPLEDVDDDDRRLDINQDKLHILYGGTKVLQHTASGKDQGCLGYVLRTSFNTSQGKLLRTILFGVKRVTANNFETFCFIMFLLVFAIWSAWYVWSKGIQDPKKSRYRLFFECTVIITSVVPPELPIELSLAVNTSLISLSKLYIYCTEPFRIPFAGKVEYCCFDKTGTLTSDDLIVEGVAGLPKAQLEDERINTKSKNDCSLNITGRGSPSTTMTKSTFAENSLVLPVDQCPTYTQQVLASCHSLTHLDEKLVGDPLEKKVLEAIGWVYGKTGVVSSKRGRAAPLKIHQRFHFNSTLKRMSVIASYKLDLSNENVYICTAKGAPEFMRPLMKSVPANYDEVYFQMSRLGARVLALGYKTLGELSHSELSALKREDVEEDLMFAGFVLISCPLKPDSRAVSLDLAQSGHRLVMITGDGALTACHVAGLLNFVSRQVLILTRRLSSDLVDKGDGWDWISTDQRVTIPFEDVSENFSTFSRQFDLCLTGESLDFVTKNLKEKLAHSIVARVKVFARVSPKQKELIITTIKSGGQTVLMCGDGTNDVGALKHAQVGVALLSSSAVPVLKPQTQKRDLKTAQLQVGDESALVKRQIIASGRPGARTNQANVSVTNQAALTPEERRREKVLEAQAKLKEMLEEQDGPQFVKLGDASIAAPFTSRLSSTQCIAHIIKQGRCTLVTTLQMFKILALNALLSAYCHSVLYLDGIKFSDGQFTIQGLLTTLCSLFITRSKPLNKLSAQRPLPNIFNLYTILTVTLQFSVHFLSLSYLYDRAKLMQESSDERNATHSVDMNDLINDIGSESSTTNSSLSDPVETVHTEFKASLVNSTVYIIWMSIQICTFVVNYKGHPFMQSLRSNRPLCYSFIVSIFVIIVCVNGWAPSLTEQLSIVEFPDEFRPVILIIILLDFGLAYLIDRACEYLFGRLKLRQL